MSVWIKRLIVVTVIAAPLAYGAWWGYPKLVGRFLDIDQAIAAYYDGNHRIAFRAFERLAPEGDPRAALWLGIAYLSGDGVDRQFLLGQTWLARSFEQGNVDAAVVLGNSLRIWRTAHESINTDYYWWYRTAADLGHSQGMLGMAIAHLDERDPRYNLTRAREWLQRAVEHGNGYAAFHLAHGHMTGDFEKGIPEADRNGEFDKFDVQHIIDLYLRGGLAGHRPSFDRGVNLLLRSSDWTDESRETLYKWSLVGSGRFEPGARYWDRSVWAAFDAVYREQPSAESGRISADEDPNDALAPRINANQWDEVQEWLETVLREPQDQPTPPPSFPGWVPALDQEAMRRVASEARDILASLPNPDPGRPRFGCMCDSNPGGYFHWSN